MQDISAGNSDNIETIVNTYGDMLYRLCYVILKSESDAEDADYMNPPYIYEEAIDIFPKSLENEFGALFLLCKESLSGDIICNSRHSRYLRFLRQLGL